MDRKFLENLGLEKETIDKVMAAHGKAIQEVKPAEDYETLKSAKEALETQVTDLETKITAKDTEYSTLNSTLEELQSENAKTKLENLRTTIAFQAGIPIDLANRLTGETEDEIKADAEKISGLVARNDILPLRTTEPEKVDVENQAYLDMAEKI